MNRYKKGSQYSIASAGCTKFWIKLRMLEKLLGYIEPLIDSESDDDFDQQAWDELAKATMDTLNCYELHMLNSYEIKSILTQDAFERLVDTLVDVLLAVKYKTVFREGYFHDVRILVADVTKKLSCSIWHSN
jgi:hypothetical protein